jgi:hypothetical protein
MTDAVVQGNIELVGNFLGNATNQQAFFFDIDVNHVATIEAAEIALTLGVDGLTTLSGGLDCSGSVIKLAKLEVTNDSDLKGKLDVASDVVFQGSFTAKNDVSLGKTTGTVAIDGTIGISGNVNVDVSKTVTVNGILSVPGTLSAKLKPRELIGTSGAVLGELFFDTTDGVLKYKLSINGSVHTLW